MTLNHYHRSIVTILALVAMSCNEGGITIHNNSPEVTIGNPLNGEQVMEGTPVQARAGVSDDKTAPESLEVQWYIGDPGDEEPITFDGTCADEESDEAELTIWWEFVPEGGDAQELDVTGGTAILDEGYQTIYLYAKAPSGKVGYDLRTIEVSPANVPPDCAITLPEDGNAGSIGGLVSLEAEVSDPDGDAGSLFVECYRPNEQPTPPRTWSSPARTMSA